MIDTLQPIIGWSFATLLMLSLLSLFVAYNSTRYCDKALHVMLFSLKGLLYICFFCLFVVVIEILSLMI